MTTAEVHPVQGFSTARGNTLTVSVDLVTGYAYIGRPAFAGVFLVLTPEKRESGCPSAEGF